MTTPTIELKPSAHPLPAAEREKILASPGFGRYFTDHMVTIKWTEGRGWHDAQLVPYAPLSMDPANMTLHYAQTIFEGLKAYRQPDGTVATFRPDANARRFQASARRLGMPELPVETFIEACDAWSGRTRTGCPPPVRNRSTCALHDRERGRPGRPARQRVPVHRHRLAGRAYFTGGVKPVSVWLSQEYVRAVRGHRRAKTGGNYAASLVAQAQAAQHGCDQVVWLDAIERRWIEEMGGMNLYFVYGNKIVTPELSGSLLPGITRDSLLKIATDLGYEPPRAASPSRTGRPPPRTAP